MQLKPYRHVVVADHERALYYEHRSLKRILMPGVYRLWNLPARVTLDTFDLTEPRFEHLRAETFFDTSSDVVDLHLHRFALGHDEVGLVYVDEVLADVLRPGERAYYWKVPHTGRLERYAIDLGVKLTDTLLAQFNRPASRVRSRAIGDAVKVFEVPAEHAGLLYRDGALVERLAPGLHGYWTYGPKHVVMLVDLRLQAIEVSGQDILSKDRVSLRVNLAAYYKVADPLKAVTSVKQYLEFAYRELQFALRRAVGGRTLDGLLADKRELEHDLYAEVRDALAPHGLELASVGLKDLILPGDMKEILNRVVEAEKAAQANVIRRREETAATRSLLNTARLMDDHPTLLRLKELEALEKVADKVDRLTVFGGLDAVLNDTVRIGVETR